MNICGGPRLLGLGLSWSKIRPNSLKSVKNQHYEGRACMSVHVWEGGNCTGGGRV